MSAAGRNINPATGTTALVDCRDDRAPARTSSSGQRAGARFDIPANLQWMTATEAATERLPGFELTERHIQRAISGGDLATRKRPGRGGGREFHWTSLPREAREEYLKRHGVAQIAAERSDDPKTKAALRDLAAEARIQIVAAAKAYIADHNMEIGAGLKSFCKLFKRRRTGLPPFVYETVQSLAPHNVRSWDRTIRTEGTGALIDRRGRPAGSGVVDRDPDLRAFVIATVAARPHLSAATIREAIKTDMQRDIPLRTLQGFLKTFRTENAALIKGLTDPDRHRSHHKPAFGNRSATIVRINQRWEIDATRADAMCIGPNGTRVRFAMTAVIDVFTRRAMVLVSDQPRAVATQALLRRAILTWGLPELLKADNGKEFVAQSVMRFCADAGIEVSLSRPFCPEEKPHIERFFGTLNHKLFPMLPDFVSHHIGGRKAIENRKSFSHRFGEEAQLAIETSLTPGQLQARVDSWLANIYEQEIHGGLKQAPALIAAAFADQVKRIGDERALDALLMDAPDAAGIRTVLKKGIRIGSRWYIAAELGAMMSDKVHVRFDPADYGRIVVYTHDRRAFLCIAECTEAMDGTRQMHIAKSAQAANRLQLRVIRSDVRKVQALHPADGLADRILGEHAGDGFVMQDESRKAFDTAARPRLVAARAALDGIDEANAAPQPQEPTAEQEANARAVIADLSPRLADAPGLVACDGYSRPNFGDDDLAFFTWAEAQRTAGGPMDAPDRELFAELAASPAFQQQLTNNRRA